MRYLRYTNYQSGNSGLSNGIMSIEIGAILAHLTNRLLVLDGNIPPPANLVSYDGRVDNAVRSRVTDLIELPVAWVEPDAVDLAGLARRELTDHSLWDCAFYFPKTLDVSSPDARAFARNRHHWVTVTGEHEQIPVLELSEQSHKRSNLGYYSYQFYFDRETRRSVYRLLQNMQAKRPFAELAQRVARDLGAFNAVHFRRGDFKVTYGVTTLDRKPAEAIEAMEPLFSRKEPLVILTDERDDPFFTAIKQAYPHHYFIDWHILDHYGDELRQLPRSDSLSLAYLSQLVAAESKEFIGTMTSTFTGLIQRYRGNRGKPEAFRYLWNELPDSEAKLERGRHAVSECILLERGEMVEDFAGPYSWNRVSQRLNPAWMREWPESFLLPEVLETGALVKDADAKPASMAARPSAPSLAAKDEAVVYVGFEDLQVAVWSKEAALLKQLAVQLGADATTQARNVIANLDVGQDATCSIVQRGSDQRMTCGEKELPQVLKRYIARIYARARHNYTWLAAAAFVKGGRGLVIAGEIADPSHALLRAIEAQGFRLIDRSIIAIRADDLVAVPLCARSQPEGAAGPGRFAAPLERLVIAKRTPLYARDTRIAPMSPAEAVAALIRASIDFRIDRDRAVNHLCRLVEKRPAAQLRFSQPDEAARIVARFSEAGWEAAA